MPRAAYGDRNTVTVMQGASHVALDFSSRVIDFVCTYGEKGPHRSVFVAVFQQFYCCVR